MSTTENKVYSLEKILEQKAQYNMIIGERSNGKTFAALEYGLKQYLISIIVNNEGYNLRLEKNPEVVSIWNFAGIEHAVISNTENCSVSWIIDRIECTVVTNCKEDVYNLIKSIYTSEV